MARNSKKRKQKKKGPPAPAPPGAPPPPAPAPHGKGKHGLHNQGATCYLNSVLQVLFMTPEFREALERSSAPEPMDRHLSTLFQSLERGTGSTTKITKLLEIKVNQQRDAADYFERILMRTSAKASKVFKGELTAKCMCLKCKNESRTNQPFWSLPLPLVESDADGCKVANGIREYFKKSEITGEDQLHCNNCKEKTDSTVKLDMTHHPEVLTLLLKRFHFDYNNMMYIKNQQKVEVPFILTVENRKYELYAFVDHFGSLKGGHYTVNIKAQDEEKWYRFDDTVVTLMDYQPLQEDYSERSENAYLLFYKANKNDDNSTQNVEGSTAGDSPKTSRNAVEKDKDSEYELKSDDTEINKEKLHCSSQVDNNKQGITSVKDEDMVENLDKPRDDDDDACVTDVEMKNLNLKAVDDREEAGKKEKPSDGNDRAKITQTSSTGSQKRRNGNNKVQGNQEQEKDEEPGTYVGDEGLKVETVEEFHSRDENDQKSGQCLNPDDQEKRDYQHNREEEDLSESNQSEPFSGGHGLSKSPPEKRKKNSFRDEGDEVPALTRTKPQGLLNEVEDQRELRNVPKGEVKEMVEERQTKVDENKRISINDMLSRSKAVYTKMYKPAQVFSKTTSMDKTALDTPIDNKKKKPTQQESLGEEIHHPTEATQLIKNKGREQGGTTGETKEKTRVEQALSRCKPRGTKRTETGEQIKSSVSDKTHLSISSQTASVPFRKAETQEIPDSGKTRHPNSPNGLSKSYHCEVSPQNSSKESMNPSTTEMQQFGGEDRKAGENGESSFVQQLNETKGRTEKQMKPAEEGEPQLENQPQVDITQYNDGQCLMEIQSSSENLEDLPSTGLLEQTVGDRPDVKSSTEADITSVPGSKVEKQTGNEKQRKVKKSKFKALFSIAAPSPRR